MLFISILFRTVTITVSPIPVSRMVIITIRFGWTPRITISRIHIGALVVDFSTVSERENTKLDHRVNEKGTSIFCQANWKQKIIVICLVQGIQIQIRIFNQLEQVLPSLFVKKILKTIYLIGLKYLKNIWLVVGSSKKNTILYSSQDLTTNSRIPIHSHHYVCLLF